MFHMTSLQYGTQRTWYGRGGTTANKIDEPINWTSPYNNPALTANAKSSQTYGYVSMFAASTAGTDYSTAATSLFDARVVRFVPFQLIKNDNAMGVAVQVAYAAAKTKYTSAKTLWDNYVAILTKNSKVDAFAAAFAPPKAPTVPPLPEKPWLPSVTGTLYKAS